MKTSRRQFIKGSLGAFALGEILASAALRQKPIPIGFQLYAVRGEFASDVPGTLKKLSELGYKGVEFWGYAGTPNIYQNRSAADLRKLLDEYHLQCCGIHLDLKALSKENLDRTIENSRILGNTYLNVAAAREKMGSEESIAEFAKFLNETAAKAQGHQMVVGYHAHPFDFVKIKDRFAWDWLFSQTKPEVNMQLDVGSCLAGNGDAIAILKKFPGRTRSIHIKEFEDKTLESDFYKEVFQLCESSGVTDWYIVEMGGADGKGYDVPREALERLHKLGK